MANGITENQRFVEWLNASMPQCLNGDFSRVLVTISLILVTGACVRLADGNQSDYDSVSDVEISNELVDAPDESQLPQTPQDLREEFRRAGRVISERPDGSFMVCGMTSSGGLTCLDPELNSKTRINTVLNN